MRKDIIVNSYWNVTVKNEYIVQGSVNLVILLPGGIYANLAPLIYYSYNISLQLGYDILAVDYGFQKTGKDVRLNDETFSRLFTETKETVVKCLLEKKYKRLTFIGKCIRTVIQSMLISDFKERVQKHVFMIPWPKCIDSIGNLDSMVVVGTHDNLLSKNTLE